MDDDDDDEEEEDDAMIDDALCDRSCVFSSMRRSCSMSEESIEPGNRADNFWRRSRVRAETFSRGFECASGVGP